jgi:NAD(P)-dependent dehydrogenase (short-subunit alcohol dehydrogenase family)
MLVRLLCVLLDLQESGTLDVLVNNAGIGHACALLDTPLDLVQAHMDTNYIGAVRMIQLVGRHAAAVWH